MASEQDLAEQLLRRADEDAAGAKAMLPISEVAAVLWARRQIEPKEPSKEAGSNPAQPQ